MLISVALVLAGGLAAGSLFRRLRLPALPGMLLVGILLGPSVWGLLDEKLLSVSPELRQIALMIILLRAGLALDLSDLKAVGRPAVLMCFVPACFEILGTVAAAPRLLGISLTEAALLGSVTAAVSPAVVVPRMLDLMKQKRGTAHRIPQLITAGASVDDIFVIVLFGAFSSLLKGGSISVMTAVEVPAAVLSGIAAGAAAGFVLVAFFKRFHMRDTVKVLILLAVSFAFAGIEPAVRNVMPFSGLLSVMVIGMTVRKRYPLLADRMTGKFSKLWVAAELWLFVLVGAAVQPALIRTAGAAVAAVIGGALLFRCVGVLLCTVGTRLTLRERLFCTAAYLPKATVQAAIGSAALDMGLACGGIVLTAAVTAILVTAPLGAILIDTLAPRLLETEAAPALSAGGKPDAGTGESKRPKR